jgi:hypothetical protein
MVPIKCPVSRAFVSYISLLISYISIINIKESTSYFPINNYLLTINDNHLEIQACGLTSDLTLYNENEVQLFSYLSIGATSPLYGAHSRTMDSELGN